MELLQRWRVVAEPGQEPKMRDFEGMPNPITAAIIPKWKFLNELVVSEKPQPQAGNDPPP